MRRNHDRPRQKRGLQSYIQGVHNYGAIMDAIRKLEGKLGKMRGGLKKYFKENPENIVVKFWG